MQEWISAGRFGSGGWQSSVYTGFEIMTLSFNKNFRLKFRKFHVPNGTELSGCPDTTRANARSCKFHANQRDSNDIGHFRVHIRLLFKASLSAKFL